MQTVIFNSQSSAVTTGHVIQAVDAQTGYTNRGATALVTVVLPPAKVGKRLVFKVEAAYEFALDPYGSEQIALPSTGVLGEAGKKLSADAVGEYVELLCLTDGEWSCIGYLGTWTAES
jgi:hypothetical protein